MLVRVGSDETTGGGQGGTGTSDASGTIGAPDGAAQAPSDPTTETEIEATQPEHSGVYILSGGALTRENSRAGIAAGDKMSSDSVQLELTPQETAPALPVLALFAAFILLGFAYGVLRYRKLR